MGDSKASIKIEFEIYDESYKADMWINYYPETNSGVDRRVIVFFVEKYAEARRKWDAKLYREQANERAEDERRSELAELARLKEKYEPAGLREAK